MSAWTIVGLLGLASVLILPVMRSTTEANHRAERCNPPMPPPGALSGGDDP